MVRVAKTAERPPRTPETEKGGERSRSLWPRTSRVPQQGPARAHPGCLSGPGRPGSLSRALSPRGCGAASQPVAARGRVPTPVPRGPTLTLLGSPSTRLELGQLLCPGWGQRSPCHPVSPSGRPAHAARKMLAHGTLRHLSLLLLLSPPNVWSDRVTTPWLSWGWNLGERHLLSVHSHGVHSLTRGLGPQWVS